MLVLKMKIIINNNNNAQSKTKRQNRKKSQTQIIEWNNIFQKMYGAIRNKQQKSLLSFHISLRAHTKKNQNSGL